MADRYLTYADVAARLSITVASARTYRQTGRLPQPDIMLGQTPGWLPETIERHVAGLAPNARARRSQP